MLLHEQTRQLLDNFIAAPRHAVIISGDPGSGLSFTADYLARALLVIKTSNHPYLRKFEPEKSNITIDQVRDLRSFLKLKTTGSSRIRRVVIIDKAHTMTLEAQNALLKTLEEPPDDTVIILTITSASPLQQTIHSRAQQISIYTLDELKAKQFFTDKGFAPNKVHSAYHLSGGAVGLMSALLSEDTGHPLRQQIDLAKQFIASPQLDKLAMVDQLIKDKSTIAELLFALQRVTRAALVQAAGSSAKASSIPAWTKRLALVHELQTKLASHPNEKLLLTHLALNL